jgi:glycosyltransferase involved in cell wall biosynthesis
MTRISVIIPTCDRPLLLERALASVGAQDRLPHEVLVVDDGGGSHADATRAVVERFHGCGARLIAAAGPNGASAARNRGAAAARGTLLAFLDDDDEWLPPYLGEAARRFESEGLEVMCTDLLYRYDDGRERPGKSAPERLVADAFLTRNPGLVGSNLIIQRALYRELGGFDESLLTSEDMDFGIRLSLRATVRYAPLRQRLVRHYQHAHDRLCMRHGAAMRAGIRRFFELHGWRMSAAELERFRRAVRELWGIDEYGRDVEPDTAQPHPS